MKVINLTDEQQKIMKTQHDLVLDIESAMQSHAKLLRDAKTAFWDFAREMFPELDNPRHAATYNREDKCIWYIEGEK